MLADFLQSHGIPARLVNRINDKENTIFDLILTETVDLVIDIPTRNNNLKDGFLIRRFAVEAGVPIYTSLDPRPGSQARQQDLLGRHHQAVETKFLNTQ
ncbi:hypothetical protein OCH80_06035 [Lactobacillus sp. 23-2]|uniref:hypothetical protein n=1 Tax=Lactobacillus sp. 23-2 TaxID=2981842 RepID=UPI003834E994